MEPSRDLMWREDAGIWVGAAPLEDVKSVLILIAHPDDMESQCGGTVRLLTSRGARVILVSCTSGDKGSHDRTIRSPELARQRESEQLAAAEYLGIEEVAFLGWPDGEVDGGKELRSSLVRFIRAYRPDVVITLDPENPWPPYTAHRDHRTVGRTALDALYPDARDHLYFPEQITDEGLEPHRTPEAWLILSSQPDWAVDITDVFESKIASRLLHRSQTRSEDDLRQRYHERASTVGNRAGVKYAEAFRRVQFR